MSKSENGERRLDVLEVRARCDALWVAFPTFPGELDKRPGKSR